MATLDYSAVWGVCAIVLLVSFSNTPGGDCKGYVLQPSSRNVEQAKKKGPERETCPHCFNSGGPEACKKRMRQYVDGQALRKYGVNAQRWVYPDLLKSPEYTYWVKKLGIPFRATVGPPELSKRFRMCGSYSQITGAEKPLYDGPTSSWPVPKGNVYTASETIEIKVSIISDVRGHFEFFLCYPNNMSKNGELDEDCFNKMPLRRVSKANEVSPIDPRHPGRYYLEPEACITEMDGFSTAKKYKTAKMYYKLPKEPCDHCVMRWYWISSISCIPFGYQGYDWAGASKRCNKGQWVDRSKKMCQGAEYPEEFWNCMDITILPQAETTTATTITTAPPTNSVLGLLHVDKTSYPGPYSTDGSLIAPTEPLHEEEAPFSMHTATHAVTTNALSKQALTLPVPDLGGMASLRSAWHMDYSVWSPGYGVFLCQCSLITFQLDSTFSWGFLTQEECLEAFRKDHRCHDSLEDSEMQRHWIRDYDHDNWSISDRAWMCKCKEAPTPYAWGFSTVERCVQDFQKEGCVVPQGSPIV